jgi:hypothetical protein
MEVEAHAENADGETLVESTALFLRMPSADESWLLAELGWD